MRYSTKPLQIDVLLFDAFSNLCLANTVEPLRAANNVSGRDLCRWRVLTLDGQAGVSSSELSIAVDGALRDHSGDLLIAIPSYDHERHATVPTSRALRAAAGRYAMLGGFDMGAWLLAKAGLLQGRKATLHWEELDRFEETFPETEALRERYVIDGDRMTCGGAHAAYDLMLDWIAMRFGAELRLDVALLLMGAPAAEPAIPSAGVSRSAARVMALMQGNIEQPLAIPQIAVSVGLTQRGLERQMQANFGMSPQTLYQRIRLRSARRLLRDTQMSVAEIALRSGYQDASAFTRAFGQEFGQTPREMRAALG